jgi:DeoR/GlpR family transcriptional regulator of sugar metabolism
MGKSNRAPGVRRAEIKRILRTKQAATVEELCKLLGASPATIRRDLIALEKSDGLERSRGGAVVPTLREAELNFAQREARDAEEKIAIAETVVAQLSPGSAVFLNDGSTVMAIAKVIVERDIELMIATPAVNVASTLTASAKVTACLLGGFVRATSLATSGPFAETMVSQINADLAIISPDGVHPERGLTFANPHDASLARRMAEQARQVMVVATRSKLMSISRVSGLPMNKVDKLVVGCPLADVPLPIREEVRGILSAAEANSSRAAAPA